MSPNRLPVGLPHTSFQSVYMRKCPKREEHAMEAESAAQC
jgi:hypothetical protein